jgi:hypothetical protein
VVDELVWLEAGGTRIHHEHLIGRIALEAIDLDSVGD